jgi:hypothetical protein
MKYQPATVGTVSTNIKLHNSYKPKVGRKIKFVRYGENNWTVGLVLHIAKDNRLTIGL